MGDGLVRRAVDRGAGLVERGTVMTGRALDPTLHRTANLRVIHPAQTSPPAPTTELAPSGPGPTWATGATGAT
ncbi:hypothetical protein AAFF_G00153060 [Aldrovandia affinis]|uniref:Uncharacterized protein n=1 Tax=Aldrovandia affinis TaxID=143900 RepID=A0AAD7VWB4_9TELE|nr:hypothetical protein AAFF_G00153060 [Aldrovandia affinis]